MMKLNQFSNIMLESQPILDRARESTDCPGTYIYSISSNKNVILRVARTANDMKKTIVNETLTVTCMSNRGQRCI
jgi:hypothetical protein